jgi:DNA-binding transcriptional MocR family regulator
MQNDDDLSWVPQIEASAGSWAQRLADAIAADIESGRLAPGDRLPTQRALARHLGITPGTVNRAYAIADRAGLISAEVGRGTFVSRSRDARLHDASLERTAGGAIELGLNYPASGDAQAALDTLLPMLARGEAALLAVAPYAGSDAHRAAGARWLRAAGVEVSGADVAVCSGIQHGLTAALTVLTAPGDVVLCESLTAPGMKSVAATRQLRLVGVDGDDDGLSPDALAAACRATGARVVYLMPTLHTPTTITMSDERRRAIADVLRAHDAIAIEDDAWAFLAGGAVTPLRAFAPDHVVHLSTFSKCLAPGLRVGYVVAPASLQRSVVAAIGAVTWTPPLMAEIASRWILDGTAAAITAQRVRTARARQELAARLLAPHVRRSGLPTFHLWLPLPEPWRVDELVAHAGSRGVTLVATDNFVPGRAPTPHAIRVCVGTEPEVARLESGLTVLARLLRSAPVGSPLPGA